MSRRRVLLGLLIGLVGPLLLGTIVVLLALSREDVAKKVIAIALGKSKGIEIAEIRGPLKGPLHLLGVSYRSGALTAQVDTLLLDWRPSRLLLGRIDLQRVYASGVHLTLPDSAPPDTAGTAKARLQRPRTPLPVILGDVSIRGIELTAPGNTTLRSGELTLDGTLDHYRFDLRGIGFAPAVGSVKAHLTGSGGLEQVTLDSSTATLLNGSASATGQVGWWPKVVWHLIVTGDSLQPAPLFPHPAQWPGYVTVRVRTRGVIDSGGPEGTASFDSIGGLLRGQRLAGHAELGFGPGRYDLPSFDLNWGSARLVARAVVGDTIAASYDLAIADLRTAARWTRGSLRVVGTARGPRLAPRLQARIEARNLASGRNRLRHLAGTADVDLAPRGRNDVELRGEQAGLGNTLFDSVRVSLRGTHPAHRLTARALGPRDSVGLTLAGGIAGARWRGRLNTLALQSGTWGGWQLERPARLALTRVSGRVDSLCLAADSAGGRICAAGDWRNTRTWNVLATIEGIPAARLPIGNPTSSLDVSGGLVGTLEARIDAHAVAGRLTGTLRAATDSVAYVWRSNADAAEHRYALDSAVVDITADRQTGIAATLGIRLSDERRKELAVLAGSLSMANYVMGSHLLRQPIDWKLDGSAADLSFLEPFVFGIDSLRGSVLLAAGGGGALAAPRVKGSVSLQQFSVGFPGRRAASGALEVAVDGGLGADRTLAGEARLISRGVGWDYWYFAQRRRLSVDSGSVILTADAAGLHGTMGFGVTDAQGAGVASLDGKLELPQYRRFGAPLATQPVTLSLAARIPDLALLQPLALSADSLAGRLSFDLSAEGRVGTPEVMATLRVDSARGRLPTGVMARGSLNGDLELDVARDHSMTGSLRIAPRDAKLSYPVGGGITTVQLDSTAFSLTAAGDGVQGGLDLRFADSNHVVMGTLVGRVALPRLSRIDADLGAQPVEAWLEGRADDLAFLETLTPRVDSAAGRLHLGVKLDGKLSALHTVGDVELSDMAARLPFLGILLEQVQFKGQGDQAGSIVLNGTLHSGGGELTLTGSTPVQPSSIQPGHIHLSARNFEAMDNAELHAVLSGTADVRIAEDSLDIRGDVTVPLARLVLNQIPETAISSSDDVVLLDSVLVLRRNRPVTAQVKITLGDSVSFSGFNFNAELGGSLLLVQANDQLPTATGTMYIEEGRYKAYGQDLRIRRGEVRFTGGPIDNPDLSVNATRTAFNGADAVTAGIRILGSLQSPDVSLYSEPPMSETQILSYILTGGPVGAGVGGSLLDKALTSLGLRGGSMLGPVLGQQVGLDQAKYSTARDVRGTSLAFGRFLTPSLYVSYGIGVFDPISTLRLRYVLSNRFTLLAEAGKVTSADALMKIESSKKPGKK